MRKLRKKANLFQEHPEEGEDIRVFTVSFPEAMDMISDGRINSASPIIALQWLAMHRDHLRSMWQ